MKVLNPLIVPKGIRYLSQWKDFKLPEEPMIINKVMTGCGFTEFCLTNSDNVVLCAPRKALLVNKEEQHSEDVLYVKNDTEVNPTYDKDLTKDKPYKTQTQVTQENIEKINAMKSGISEYIFQCYRKNKPVKILVTYDSFRHVKDVIKNSLGSYYIVIDEFQSIFTDSKFKPDTEFSFLRQVQDIKKVCYVSATPFMEKYLNMLPEFQEMPYVELDWHTDDPYRVMKPALEVYKSKSLMADIKNVIDSYKNGNFETYPMKNEVTGEIEEVESRECIIFVNSVKNICEVIKRNGLTFDETNVICADTKENEAKVRAAFKPGPGVKKVIGKIPRKHESSKMFTLCTRTVYLGADFYSNCARSFIFSDANIDCLSVDISLDLPQILGRQRNDKNPWKNSAELYVKLYRGELEREEFEKYIEKKTQETFDLLDNYNEVTKKDVLANAYKDLAKAYHYRRNYIGVNSHGGKNLVPVFNQLVKVNELRSFELQQMEYRSWFTLFTSIRDTGISANEKINSILDEFYAISSFDKRLKFLCQQKDMLEEKDMNYLLSQVPVNFRKYYYSIGPEKCGTCHYTKKLLDECLNSDKIDIKDIVTSTFSVGKTYTLKVIKEVLGQIYEDNGIKKVSKATDLSEWFELKRVQATINGKRENLFYIISVK